MPTSTSTRFDEQTIVLTTEGRRRLEARLQAAVAELEELDHSVEQRGETSEQRTEELAERARLMDRVTSLRETLHRAVGVDAVDEDPSIIELGDEVEIEHADGERERLLLVHPVEVDAERGHVSVDSPLAKALLGRRVGDRVEVRAPAGVYEVNVLERTRGH